MSDIRQWLEELGLSQYADAFEREEVDLDTLPDLTELMLKEMGLPIGPRAKVLRAAKSLRIDDAERDETVPIKAEQSKPEADRLAEAERRQITVMFCDLVGSTALSEKLDPEDLRTLMVAYQKACGAVVNRYEGHVAQYLGDGLMTYFGWPKAHEDDSERAVRAGLDIVEAVTNLDAPLNLAVRVGVATGLVVVGETGGGDPSIAKTAVGEAPNIAARLQALADPNTVAIGESTRQLIGGAFDLDHLGAHELKGVSAPLSVYRVTGESAAETRFEATHQTGMTPLVGREEEVGLLLKRWEQAKDGDGQVVLLYGEPGIGKSRITQTLRERIGEEPHTRLRYQCSPYHTNSAFHPIIEQIARAARFDRDDTPDAKLDKLEALLSLSAEDVTKVAPLFAAMLSLPTDRYPSLNLSPLRQKEDTIATLADQTVALSLRDPVLMIFEDAHWIDPTSLEVLDRVIDRIQDATVLLVITCRPEFESPWSGQGHVTMHSLNRLSRRQGADMIAKVTGGKPLPDEVLDEIIAKTDGVPLFVEELTKTVLEAGFLKQEPDRYVLDGPLPPLAIPATLQDSLMARLDRLAPVKETAQIGACIGREFSFELLSAVSSLGDDALGEALSQLTSAELIFRRGAPPNATYTFKHALVQDAAYESLLKSNRRKLHARIAELLENRFTDIAATQPELLAHHEEEAGLFEQAIEHWRLAGHRAAARSANLEAVRQFDRGLVLIDMIKDLPRRSSVELRLRIANGTPLIATLGHAAKEVGENFARAATLCDQVDDPELLFPALYGQWVNLHARGQHHDAKPISERLLEMAERHGDRVGQLMGRRVTGVLDTMFGDLISARSNLKKAISLYDVSKDQDLALRYGQDPRAAALAYLAFVLSLLGYSRQSIEVGNQAMAWADTLGHKFTRGYTLWWAGCIPSIVRRDFEQLADHARELSVLSEAEGFQPWPVVANFGLSFSRFAGIGDSLTADDLKNISDYHELTQIQMLMPFFSSLAAEMLATEGNRGVTLTRFDDAVRLTEETFETWAEPEILRMRGCLLLESNGREEQAEADFCDSLDLARTQQAKLWELRTSIALAQLWQTQGKRQDAQDLLAPVYDWFTEGYETADLRDAKALLRELEA